TRAPRRRRRRRSPTPGRGRTEDRSPSDAPKVSRERLPVGAVTARVLNIWGFGDEIRPTDADASTVAALLFWSGQISPSGEELWPPKTRLPRCRKSWPTSKSSYS